MLIMNVKIMELKTVNNVLKLDCVKYDYNSIKNSNTLPDNLWQDGLGLSNVGKCKLLNNALVSLKKKIF